MNPMAISSSGTNVIPFPGVYAQPGPYEYDNRALTPEDMDEFSEWVAAQPAVARQAA